MRFTSPASLLATAALLAPALLGHAIAAPTPATAPPAAATAAAPAAPPSDPNMVVATVNGEKITLGDLRQAAATMPAQLRQLPQNMVLPMLVNQLVDQKAIQIIAHKENLQNDPEVKTAMETAATNALQNAWLSKQVTPLLTDAAIQAKYDQDYAKKAPEQEVHARHILLKTEPEALDVIKQLKGGADFGTLATKLSTDTGSAKNNGGDLGWFKKGDMIPAFSDAAFSMKPGTYSQTPVKSQYGYHVIQVLETRTVPTPKLDEVKDKIRQQLIQEDVRAAVSKAAAQVKIVHYGPDGKVVPDAPATAPAAAPATPKK
ncbi:peptidylprolyl isomerase [Acetobacter sacchari]|uniref:Parvulin-like PPIase n=1 Tax=Acetobacter sacchari TaxID=2661687 RepID=A0ABS3M121_9PROT|nr:peptidylprolyl isomerase [Acetobacter sacchari]MBO1361844.1 peptidylprolyl isomerase [Acetobacter sacchari]